MCEEEQFHKLERRVDAVEERLTKVETSLSDMRGEVKGGFDEMRANGSDRAWASREVGMTEDELQDLVSRFVMNKVDVDALPVGTVAELAHVLARMYRARIWN